MKRNFLFDGFSVVKWNDRLIDLHNAYDLVGFGTDLNGREIELRFTRNVHAIEPSKLPSQVKLTCKGNVRVGFNNLCAIAAPIDDEGIELGYFDEDCDWNSILDERLTEGREPAGLHIWFINGFAVRIFCDDATFIVE